MRGAAMPNDSRRPWSSTTSVRSSASGVIRRGTSARGRCVVASATRNGPATSSITGCAPPAFAARYSVCPWNGIPASLIDGLLHRRGHHGREAAGDAALGGRIEQGEHVAGVRGVRPARRRRAAEPRRQHGQRSGTVRYGRGVGAPFGRLEWQPEPACALREQVGVAREDDLEWPIGKRGREREIGTDAGRLAGRDDDAASGQGFLIST